MTNQNLILFLNKRDYNNDNNNNNNNNNNNFPPNFPVRKFSVNGPFLHIFG